MKGFDLCVFETSAVGFQKTLEPLLFLEQWCEQDDKHTYLNVLLILDVIVTLIKLSFHRLHENANDNILSMSVCDYYK